MFEKKKGDEMCSPRPESPNAHFCPIGPEQNQQGFRTALSVHLKRGIDHGFDDIVNLVFADFPCSLHQVNARFPSPL